MPRYHWLPCSDLEFIFTYIHGNRLIAIDLTSLNPYIHSYTYELILAANCFFLLFFISYMLPLLIACSDHLAWMVSAVTCYYHDSQVWLLSFMCLNHDPTHDFCPFFCYYPFYCYCLDLMNYNHTCIWMWESAYYHAIYFHYIYLCVLFDVSSMICIVNQSI